MKRMCKSRLVASTGIPQTARQASHFTTAALGKVIDEKAGSLTDALTAVRVEGSGVSGDVVNYLDFLGRLLIVLVVMI